jgi:hypothetical protein
MANDATEMQDLDVFLTSVESKLRAPFSSLEIARAISAAPSPTNYLEMISQVLVRMEKVIQLRLIVGLLGVERNDEMDVVLLELLTQAQDKTLYEDWTRVAAGLVQGILFSNNDGERDVGTEAINVLVKACGGEDAKKVVGEQVDSKKRSGILDQLSKEVSNDMVDMNPLFAPFYYSLVNPDTLERILPECMSNPHFGVNEDADILNEDEKREQEEQNAAPMATGLVSEESAPAALPPVIMPGSRKATTQKPKTATTSGKSSMFLPSRKPTAVMARRMTNARKPVLHTRKAGAAQNLLGKSRQLGAKSSAATSGRSAKFGNARSKMKMIDVSEVSELNKERQERETKEQKMTARKRKIMEAAAAKGLGVKKSKPSQAETASTDEVPPAAGEAPNKPGRLEQAVAALLQHQQPSEQPTENAATQVQTPGAAVAAASIAPGNKEELDALLEKSNKLTEENRVRVKQFWLDRINPTPEMPVVRMKLHEERNIDPESGSTVKETDYLELDYNTFVYKKLRKTKKK